MHKYIRVIIRGEDLECKFGRPHATEILGESTQECQRTMGVTVYDGYDYDAEGPQALPEFQLPKSQVFFSEINL